MKMGRNKIEKDFREKLSQREISPSVNAWDRLDAMLTVAEEKKPKRNFSWLYIAASVIGFLLIGTVFLGTTEELIDSKRNDVVFENQNPKTEINDSGSIQEQPSETIAEAETEIANDTNANRPKEVRQIQNIRKTKNQSQLAENTINQNNQSRDFGTIINQKTDIQSAVASNLQADELLAMALSKSNTGTTGTSVKVNAKNLLSEVDGELNQTFRDKVINSVGKNYRNAKVAIANRNNLEDQNQ